jgi:hypothetical protein
MARSVGLAALAIMTLDAAPPLIGPASASEAWAPAILSDETLAGTYLPDFSYAGYHWGEEPPPHPPPTLDVTDFGAAPDDGEDDTAAILKAVDAALCAWRRPGYLSSWTRRTRRSSKHWFQCLPSRPPRCA